MIDFKICLTIAFEQDSSWTFLFVFLANIGSSGSAIFHNDAQTTVEQQIGQTDFFNNQPGGKEKRQFMNITLH